MGEEEEKKEEKEKKDVKENGEIVMKVDMHCEGCARKVIKSLKRFDGVEEVRVDLKMHRVVVKGKVENALKMCERIEKKNAKKVELLSPSKEVIESAVKKAEEQKKKDVKTAEKKEEKPVIIVVLNVHMHCENCSQELRRTIEKMKGIQSVEVDLKRQQVTVKGVFESESLAAHVRRRTGKHAAVVKQETVQKKEEQDKSKEGKKGKEKGGGGEAEKKNGLGDEAAAATATKAAEGVKRSETPVVPRYVDYAYPIQIFSDENPNACSVM